MPPPRLGNWLNAVMAGIVTHPPNNCKGQRIADLGGSWPGFPWRPRSVLRRIPGQVFDQDDRDAGGRGLGFLRRMDAAADYYGFGGYAGSLF